MKKIIILIMLAFMACITVTATPYTNKCEEIFIKYYCYGKYGYNRGLTTEDAFAMAMFGAEASARLQLANYILKHNAQTGTQWLENMEKELKMARSLMNEDDYYNEYLNSQHGRLTSLIKSQFKEKYVKDEFETLEQYKNRAQAKAKLSFDSICESVMADFIISANFVIKPISYNAEKGIYNVKFIEKYVIDPKEVKNEYETSFPMQSDEARQFMEISIAPDDIVSIEWITDENDIHAKTITFKDSNGSETTFSAGFRSDSPLLFEYDKFREVYPLIPGHTWNANQLVDHYEEYAAEVKKIVAQYNQQLKQNPYYLPEMGTECLLRNKNYTPSRANRYSRAKMEEEVDHAKVEMKSDYDSNVVWIKGTLRKIAPDKYIELYAAEHPEFEERVNRLMNDYKCYDYTYNDFAFIVIDNRTMKERTCYNEYMGLFNDNAEFNMYYEDKEKFMAKVAERKQIKAIYNSVFNKVSVQEPPVVFKGATSAKEQGVNKIFVKPLSQIKDVDEWYNSVLKLFFELDPKMSKEYEKVGPLFESKGEFFEAYVSADYKQFLREKKKK